MLKTGANGIVFFLELAMFGSLAFCGFRLGNGQLAGWIMAIIFPVIFIMLWSRWAAPKSSRKLPPRRRLLFRLSLFLIAFSLLAITGYPVLAMSLFLIAVAGESLGETARD